MDLLTGSHSLLRAEIVMDVGESLNPAIDITQVEGAFMQGYGYLCMEDTTFSDSGLLLTRGLADYSAPTIRHSHTQNTIITILASLGTYRPCSTSPCCGATVRPTTGACSTPANASGSRPSSAVSPPSSPSRQHLEIWMVECRSDT